MEEINTDQKEKKEEKNKERNNIDYINSSPPLRLDRSYDNTINRRTGDLNFTSYNIASENNNRKINLEKYNNIRQINRSPQTSPRYGCGIHCSNSVLCPYINHCFLHHVHFHHIHIPHNHFCPRLTNTLSPRAEEKQRQLNNDLLNEVAELRNDCRKFKEELEKTKNENEAGNKYIKLLEKQIHTKDKEDIKNYNINVRREKIEKIEIDEDEDEDEKKEIIKNKKKSKGGLKLTKRKNFG